MPLELLIAELQQLAKMSPGRRTLVKFSYPYGSRYVVGADLDNQGDVTLKLEKY